MEELVLLAPAKVNLSLHVLGRRDDGYHDLAMLMVPLAFGDHVRIALCDEPGLVFGCEGVELPAGGENIAARAARCILDRAGYAGGVEIDIEKQIPVAAGLGGGSSDAATVLCGLNRLLDLGLGEPELMEIGVGLGADVPFFVRGQASWATGIGERLEVVGNLPFAWYVLANPGLAVSTAWVYGNLGLTTPRTPTKMPRFSGQIDEITGLLHNDLEPVTSARYPEVAELKRQMLDLGALGALMSGSGPTVFGLFQDEGTARRAAAELSRNAERRVVVTTALDARS